MKKIILLSALAVLALTGFGCIKIGSNTSQTSDGGVYSSSDKGATWTQVNAVPTPKGVGNMNSINVMDLMFDPQDEKAIYMSSAGTGLFYTWDAGASWKYAENLGSGYVNSVAITYDNKCQIYAALQNKIWKTKDCARSWTSMYYDTRSSSYISYIAIDPQDSGDVFAGLSTGDLIKSSDAGKSWSTIYRFNGKVQKLMIPKGADIMLAAIESNGLYRSADNGKNWTSLSENLKDYSDANQVYDLDIDKSNKALYLTSAYGILISDDLGSAWKKVELLTPANSSSKIYAFAVNPNDADEIYYSTANTFYSSSDGGKTWKTAKLPTSRAGTALLVDPKDSNLIYMGTRQFK